MKQENYTGKTSFNEDIYKAMSLEEIREKVKNFPKFTLQNAKDLEFLQNQKPETEEELKKNTRETHLLLFMRHRASASAMCLDPYFEHFDKQNGIRAIECDYIIRELF